MQHEVVGYKWMEINPERRRFAWVLKHGLRQKGRNHSEVISNQLLEGTERGTQTCRHTDVQVHARFATSGRHKREHSDKLKYFSLCESSWDTPISILSSSFFFMFDVLFWWWSDSCWEIKWIMNWKNTHTPKKKLFSSVKTGANLLIRTLITVCTVEETKSDTSPAAF